MATAELNGTSIWYEQEGTGPPCLVLHGGLGVDHALYQGTLTPLTERLRLTYFDHRGNGRSGRPPTDTITMEQLADDAAALARHLGLEHVVVLGHSYGGFVAQELTLRYPELVSALLLIDTTPGQLSATESTEDDQGPPPPPELAEAMSVIPSTDDELAVGEPSAAVEPVELARGEFISLDHGTSGISRVLELADGRRIVRLDGLDTSNGPDLYLYLTTNPARGDEAAFDDDYVSLGRLKGNQGDQNYDLPADADLTRLSTVVIWCDRFDSAFGAADLVHEGSAQG